MPPGDSSSSQRIFARFAGGAGIDIELLCFPYAGGGTQVFRGWQARVPAGIGVTGVRLPGREQRFREPARHSWPAALAELAAAIAPLTRQGHYALFGHSLGARLAYELALRLTSEGCPAPEMIVVSGCHAPGVKQRTQPMHLMDGPALTARLHELNGVPPEVLASPKLMGLLEPVLRADLRLAETWPESPGPVAAPILSLCGGNDDIAPYEDMLGWQHHTTGGFAIQSFPAGHFFLQTNEEAVVATVVDHLLTARAW